MRATRAALGTFLSITVIAGCNDPLQLDVLKPESTFEPLRIDFGEVTVGTSRTETVLLRNIGVPPLSVDQIDVPDSFSVDAGKEVFAGLKIAPGDSIELQVSFLAIEEGAREGTVIVHSESIEVPLQVSGTGVIRRIPELTIEPSTLDFGVVEIGTEARQTVTITNSGLAAGTIDQASLASTMQYVTDGDEYRLGTPPPFTIAAGQSATIEVVFRPAVEGPRPDRMTFGVTDGQHGPVDLIVTGEGRIPQGELICTPSSVEFGPVERGQVATNMVACTARGGPARLVSATVALTQPGNSTEFVLPMPVATTDLDEGSSVLIPVEFHPQGLPRMLRSTLNITYNGGMGVGTLDVPLTGEVVPPPSTATAVTLRLTWDSNFTDVDIHFVRPGGVLFDRRGASDCYFGDRRPDWNVSGDPSDNPFLDVDDTNGFGPEEVNLQTTAPGAYEVFAHYYSDRSRGPTNATIEIHIGGQLAGTFMQRISCNELWHVGTVNWDGSMGTFTPNGVTRMSSEGSCR